MAAGPHGDATLAVPFHLDPAYAMTQARFPYVLAYCRAGFEPECEGELAASAQRHDLAGRTEYRTRQGHVLFRLDEAATVARLEPAFPLGRLVFARQLVFVAEHLADLPPRDRVAPITQAAARLGRRFSAVWLETADTNDGKELSTLCRRLAGRLAGALQEERLLAPEDRAAARLHVFFVDGSEAYLGLTLPALSSPWPMGIPRLRMPREAPSRSTLKLAEALLVLLDDGERQALLRPGMRAADLGAAPGGWSWQMASRGLHVWAVDNGRMASAVLATGLVEHLRADGFTWRPQRPVDWLLCDMAAQPARIAVLVADWLARGNARHAFFNLKLPMRRRRDEVEHCRTLVEERLAKAGSEAFLRIKHLYHDREEVTAYLRCG